MFNKEQNRKLSKVMGTIMDKQEVSSDDNEQTKNEQSQEKTYQ